MSHPAQAGFDDIIDVRSPSEFSEDHLPGAINLPVLSDEERANVGTIYKQVSPFDARKIGAALVAANAARHIAGPLADRSGGWRPLVYCWRGGQRSGSFASILSQIGWRVELVAGGYKSWRHLVVSRLTAMTFPAPVVVIDGNTGSAKTELLTLLAARGHQVIDLEALANHRGSLFGAMGAQPGQKLFERDLALAIEALHPSRPVLVEAESSRIGRLNLPRAVWRAICDAPRLRLDVTLEARADHLVRAYGDIIADPQRVAETLDRLSPLHPKERIAAWHEMLGRGEWAALAAGLMRDHYDPRYAKHRTRYAESEAGIIRADSLRPEALNRLASQVEAELARIAPAVRPSPPPSTDPAPDR